MLNGLQEAVIDLTGDLIDVFLYFLYHFENQSTFYFNSRYRLSVGLRLSRSHDGDGNSPMKTVGDDTDGRRDWLKMKTIGRRTTGNSGLVGRP